MRKLNAQKLCAFINNNVVRGRLSESLLHEIFVTRNIRDFRLSITRYGPIKSKKRNASKWSIFCPFVVCLLTEESTAIKR